MSKNGRHSVGAPSDHARNCRNHRLKPSSRPGFRLCRNRSAGLPVCNRPPTCTSLRMLPPPARMLTVGERKVPALVPVAVSVATAAPGSPFVHHSNASSWTQYGVRGQQHRRNSGRTPDRTPAHNHRNSCPGRPGPPSGLDEARRRSRPPGEAVPPAREPLPPAETVGRTGDRLRRGDGRGSPPWPQALHRPFDGQAAEAVTLRLRLAVGQPMQGSRRRGGCP